MKNRRNYTCKLILFSWLAFIYACKDNSNTLTSACKQYVTIRETVEYYMITSDIDVTHFAPCGQIDVTQVDSITYRYSGIANGIDYNGFADRVDKRLDTIEYTFRMDLIQSDRKGQHYIDNVSYEPTPANYAQMAYEIFMDSLIHMDEYFENHRLVFDPELKENTDLTINLRFCEKIVANQLRLNQSRDTVYESYMEISHPNSALKLRNQASGHDLKPIHCNVFNMIALNEEYMIKIECIKRDSRSNAYTKDYYLFLDENGTLIDWCMKPLLDVGYHGK